MKKTLKGLIQSVTNEYSIETVKRGSEYRLTLYRACDCSRVSDMIKRFVDIQSNGIAYPFTYELKAKY